MATERAFPGSAPATIGRGLVASSFQYYLIGTERLRIQMVAPFAFDAVVDVGARLWREADQQIQVQRERLVCDVSGFGAADYTLAAGALLNVRLSTETADAVLGRLFVRAQLIIGTGAAATVIGTLAQGYISPQNDRAWPGSPIESMADGLGALVKPSFSVVNPSQVFWIVPTGVRWRIMSGRTQFQASAAAGNRTLLLEVLDPSGAMIWQSTNGVLVAAGGGVGASFGAGQSFSNDASLLVTYLSIPNDLELAGTSLVRVICFNAQVGDVFLNPAMYVREWLDQ